MPDLCEDYVQATLNLQSIHPGKTGRRSGTVTTRWKCSSVHVHALLFQEFLVHLLDLLETHATKRALLDQRPGISYHLPHQLMQHDLSWKPKQPSLPLCTLYRGRLCSSVLCRLCGHESRAYDPFETLSLEIDGCTSIEECLRKFSSIEVRNRHNAEHWPSNSLSLVSHVCRFLMTRINTVVVNAKISFAPKNG